MYIKVKNYKYSVKRLIYAICFFLFCIIDQRSKTCSGLDGWLETFRDLTGIVMAVVIMSHYHLRDFTKWKIPYLVWTAICVVGTPLAFLWGKDNRPFLNDWIVMLLDVILYGYIFIHTFIDTVLEKKHPKMERNYLVVWLIMMVLMIVSRSTYIWPLTHLVMFGCFYLTDYSKEERNDLFQGMLDGIILGFFVLQGLCFVFRPYDVVRYKGFFSNVSWNALFYVEVLAAVFAKILYVIKTNADKRVKAYYWIGAGVVISFELLTISRSGFIVTILIVFALMLFLKKVQKPFYLWKNFMVLALCAAISFPLCFSAARYLPPVFHHPVWLWGEWSEERVHSWDPWNSPKYIDIDEYMEKALGRITGSFTNLLEHSPVLMKADAAEDIDAASSDSAQVDANVPANMDSPEELPANKIPVLTPEQGKDGFLVRSTIYKYYFKHLNLWGHPYEEQGFQLRENYWIGHAHNIFLQYGTDFGIPVMILFVILIIWGPIIQWKKYRKDGSVEHAAAWMYLLIPAVFGMFEYSWGVGSLSISMVFIAWRKVVCSEE